MLTLTKLKSTREGKPYAVPLRVKVCGIGPITDYRTDKGEDKRSVVIGVAEKDTAMKVNCYDTSKLSTSVKTGASIMLLNYIHKTTPTHCLVITTKTKIMQTSDVEVSESGRLEAERIANPTPAEVISISQAKTSPVKSLVSVAGRVVSEEMVRQVQVKGSPVSVKTVTLKAAEDEISVSLWRQLSNQNLNGQYIKLKNVVVNLYKDEVSLSTTTRTEIEHVEQPSSTEKGSLTAFCVEELLFTFVVEIDTVFKTYTIAKEAVKRALGDNMIEEDLEQVLKERLPAIITMHVKESHIDSFTFDCQ